MSTIGKLPIVISDQPQPRLMDQRHGLQSLIGRFIRHFGRRQLAQFFWIPWFPWSAEIDKRKSRIATRRAGDYLPERQRVSPVHAVTPQKHSVETRYCDGVLLLCPAQKII
jgi:hypothetical protein